MCGFDASRVKIRRTSASIERPLSAAWSAIRCFTDGSKPLTIIDAKVTTPSLISLTISEPEFLSTQ